jgi:hypothetical protein
MGKELRSKRRNRSSRHASPRVKRGTYQAGYEIYAVSIVVVIHLYLTGNPFLLASFCKKGLD